LDEPPVEASYARGNAQNPHKKRHNEEFKGVEKHTWMEKGDEQRNDQKKGEEKKKKGIKLRDKSEDGKWKDFLSYKFLEASED